MPLSHLPGNLLANGAVLLDSYRIDLQNFDFRFVAVRDYPAKEIGRSTGQCSEPRCNGAARATFSHSEGRVPFHKQTVHLLLHSGRLVTDDVLRNQRPQLLEALLDFLRDLPPVDLVGRQPQPHGPGLGR